MFSHGDLTTAQLAPPRLVGGTRTSEPRRLARAVTASTLPTSRQMLNTASP